MLLRVAEKTLDVCFAVKSREQFLNPSNFVLVCFDLMKVLKEFVRRNARKPDVRVAFELHMMNAGEIGTMLEIIPHFGHRFVNVDGV